MVKKNFSEINVRAAMITGAVLSSVVWLFGLGMGFGGTGFMGGMMGYYAGYAGFAAAYLLLLILVVIFGAVLGAVLAWVYNWALKFR